MQTDVTYRAAARLLAQKSRVSGIGHQFDLAAAARHADHVELRAIGESRCRHDREAGIGRHRIARLPDHVHLGARHARQDLGRAGSIELGDVGIEQDADLDGLSHGDLLDVSHLAQIALAEMTKEVYFLPMAKHRIFILAYEGCQLLDVTGPAAVFGAANEPGAAFYDLGIVSPDGGAVTSNAGVAIQSRKIGGQPDTLLVAGGSRGLKAAMARDDLRRWLRAGGAQGQALRLGVHRRVRAGGGGAAGRQARGDALGKLRAPGAGLPGARGRRRFALRRRRQDLDVGRRHDRHRHGAGAGRGRPWRCHGEPDRAALRALCPAARIPVAVQPAAAGPDRGRGAVRRADRLDAGRIWTSRSTCRPSRPVPA